MYLVGAVVVFLFMNCSRNSFIISTLKPITKLVMVFPELVVVAAFLFSLSLYIFLLTEMSVVYQNKNSSNLMGFSVWLCLFKKKTTKLKEK